MAEIVVLDKGLKVRRLKVEGEFGKRQVRPVLSLICDEALQRTDVNHLLV